MRDDARLAGRRAGFAEHGRLDRQDLALEASLRDRLRRLLLRREREAIDVLARDAAILRDPLGRLELRRRLIPRPVRRLEKAGAVDHVRTQADVAHHLDPAGDADVDAARLNQRVHQVVRLLARAALRIHRRAGGLEGLAAPTARRSARCCSTARPPASRNRR